MTVPLNQYDCLNKPIDPLSHHLKSLHEKAAKTSPLSQQQVNSAAASQRTDSDNKQAATTKIAGWSKQINTKCEHALSR